MLVVLTNLKLLGSSRSARPFAWWRRRAWRSGLLPVLAHLHDLSVRFALLAVGTIAIKGIVFPWFLFRAVREAEVAREIEPYVGYVASLLSGVVVAGRVILDVHAAADAGSTSPRRGWRRWRFFPFSPGCSSSSAANAR